MSTVAASTRTASYTVATDSPGPFPVGFRVFATSSVEVYINAIKRTDWTMTATLTAGYDDAATITFSGTITAGTVIVTDGNLATARSADFLPSQPDLVGSLNDEFTLLTAAVQEVKREVSRSLRGKDTLSPVDGLAATDLDDFATFLSAVDTGSDGTLTLSNTGATSPVSGVFASSTLRIQSAGGAAHQTTIRNSADASGAGLNLAKSRSVAAGGTEIVNSGDVIGQVVAYGADGSTFTPAAVLRFVVSGSPASNDVRSEIQLRTGTGGGVNATGLVVNINQAVLAYSPTGGLGYGPGSGGTYTQATSKSTSVAVTTVTGKITMNAAALAANTTVRFNVTGSVIVATDMPDVKLVSPAGKYKCGIGATSAASFEVWVQNDTGGSLSEAVVLRFGLLRSSDS